MKNTLSEVVIPIKEELQQLEVLFQHDCQEEIAVIQDIGKYIFKNSGKKIRPILLLLTAKAHNYHENDVLDLCAAVEYVHIATLLHDDILDDAFFRRNTANVRSVWGNKISVLAGDFLFSHALKKALLFQRIDIVDCLSQTITALVQGELQQLHNTLNFSIENYFTIIKNKTASLVAVSLQIASLLSPHHAHHHKNFYSQGEYFGYAFQITDDILDYSGEKEMMGKEVGNDLREKKMTLPLCLLFHSADTNEKNFISTVLKKEKIENNDFLYMKDLMKKYTILEKCWQQAQSFIQQFETSLESFPQNVYTESLHKLAQFVLQRHH